MTAAILKGAGLADAGLGTVIEPEGLPGSKIQPVSLCGTPITLHPDSVLTKAVSEVVKCTLYQ